MAPTIAPDEEVLVDPNAYRRGPPRQGDVVLARHPFVEDTLLIKRVDHVTAGCRCFLRGDNPDSLESTDSRSFGTIAADAIVGRVVWVLP